MASPVGSVYVNLGVNSAEFHTGMKKAQGEVQAFGQGVQRASRMAAANMRNLQFQLVDIGQALATAPTMGIYALQNLGFQVAQIGQLYMGQGGFNQALKDSAAQIATFARYAGPAIAVVGLIAAGFAGLTHEINETSDVTVTFGDTALAAFQVARDAIHDVLRPAIEAIAPWFQTAWDLVVAGVKIAGNFVINGWRIVFEGVKATVSAVPGMFAAAWNGAAAAVFSAMQTIVLGVDSALASVANGLNEVFGTSFAAPSALLDAWGELNVMRGNAAGAAAAGASQASAAWEGFKGRAAEIAASDPMGAIFGAISGQAQQNARDRLAEDASKGGGGGRGGRGGKSDAEKAAEQAAREAERLAEEAEREAERRREAYADMIAGGQEFIAAQQLEARTIGMTEEAANRLRYEFEFLNDAQRQGIDLTPEQTARLGELAAGMARAEESTSALRDAFEFTRDTARGFFSDFTDGLRNGEGLWKSFANAATSALDKIISKLMDSAFDSMFSLGSTGGGGGILGSIFGAFKGLFASGGAIPSGGWGIAGEAGAEIVTGPARVFSNADSRRMMGGGGGAVNLTQNFDFRGSSNITPAMVRAEAERGGQRAVASLLEAQREYPVIR